MRVAFVFPGQGTDLARVGVDLAREVPSVRPLLALAASGTGVALADFWARGGRSLERTEVYQPVLTAVALGVHAALLARGLRPDVVAGHSLGELPAWSAAGGIDPEDAVRVAVERGRLMAECAAACPGGMLALARPEGMGLEEVLGVGAAGGTAYLGAVNAPGEWVVGGTESALQAIAALIPSARLPVAGPWHGPLMADAVPAYRRVLDAFPARPLERPLVSSVTGELVADGSDVPALMLDQLVRPVQWVRAVATVAATGVTDVVTIGPGKVLRGLIRRNGMEGVQLHATERLEDIACTLERLRR